MLKPFLVFAAVVLFALTPTPTMGGRPQEASPSPAAGKNAKPASPEAQAKAKEIYTRDCTLCHADNGNGQTDVGKAVNVSGDWSDPKTLTGKTDDALFDIIRKGKGNMPPEADSRADDNAVRALIVYIRNFSKGKTAAAPEAK